MLNKEKLLFSSFLGEGWRKIVPAKGSDGYLGWGVYSVAAQSYGEISDRYVSGELLTFVNSSAEYKRTYIGFGDYGWDKPFEYIYFMRKGGELKKVSYNLSYYFGEVVFTEEDIGKTIDIYLGTTPPL